MSERLKTCPACGNRFDTWHPLEHWSRETCAASDESLTHYNEYNNR